VPRERGDGGKGNAGIEMPLPTTPGQPLENWADQMTASIALLARARYPNDLKKRAALFNSEIEKLTNKIWNAASVLKRATGL
jgi:hypothetical protein